MIGSLAKWFLKCIQRDKLETTLNYTGFQQTSLKRMIFPKYSHSSCKRRWTTDGILHGRYLQLNNEENNLTQSPDSVSPAPPLHQGCVCVLQNFSKALLMQLTRAWGIYGVRDPGWMHTWTVSLKIHFHWKWHFDLPERKPSSSSTTVKDKERSYWLMQEIFIWENQGFLTTEGLSQNASPTLLWLHHDLKMLLRPWP